MSTPNRVTQVIPPEVIAAVTANFNAIKDALQPFIQGLTPEERKTIPKVSNKTISFVTKSDSYTETNANFAPVFMDVKDFSVDVQVLNQLKPLLDMSEQIFSNIDDTLMLAGSEAYLAALMYYNSVKFAAKSGLPDAKPIYEDLSERFPGVKRKKPGTTEQ
jgi:PHD/YefM family antitoxin component YafN of YafNO toxin-antitoxin module